MSSSSDEVAVADPRAISRDLFSATLGSICCCYTGQPLDTIKVRMQTSPAEYHGVWSTTVKISGEGLSAFWKGAVPTAMGMAAENAVAFGVNEALKRAFPDDPETRMADERPDLLKPFLMVRSGKIRRDDWQVATNRSDSVYSPPRFFLLSTYTHAHRAQSQDAVRPWYCFPVRLSRQRLKWW
jgi:hypothetical protein